MHNATHSPTCSGCPVCSDLALAIISNPTNPILGEAMGRPHLRALAERELRAAGAPRAALSPTPRSAAAAPVAVSELVAAARREFSDDGYDPHGQAPDPYAAALAQRRDAAPHTTERTARVEPDIPNYNRLTPPDPYALALARRREEHR